MSGGYHTGTVALPRLLIGQPSAHGGLDPVIVRRYLKRDHEHFEYCYEKQLLATPALAGKVDVQFEIADDGTVTTASASGLNDEMASCIADAVRRIALPRPKAGGGSVTVELRFELPG